MMSVDRPDLGETYLTVAEVADLLKLNQQTVRNWIDQGSLPAVRIGRRVRIRRSDFERVLAEGSTVDNRVSTPRAGPSAEDFWGGEPVGVAEPGPSIGSGQPDQESGEPPGGVGAG
jgi:excisionase family DNA binding protein